MEEFNCHKIIVRPLIDTLIRSHRYPFLFYLLISSFFMHSSSCCIKPIDSAKLWRWANQHTLVATFHDHSPNQNCLQYFFSLFGYPTHHRRMTNPVPMFYSFPWTISTTGSDAWEGTLKPKHPISIGSPQPGLCSPMRIVPLLHAMVLERLLW